MLTVLNRFCMRQRAVTIGMWNSYEGELQNVKTLLELGLVSIHDKDAVSLFVVVACISSTLT